MIWESKGNDFLKQKGNWGLSFENGDCGKHFPGIASMVDCLAWKDGFCISSFSFPLLSCVW